MDELSPTPRDMWDFTPYLNNNRWTEPIMPNDSHLDTQSESLLPFEHDSLSYPQMSPDVSSQFWPTSDLNPGMMYSSYHSRTSTLSSYPESSMFNSDNLVSLLSKDIMIHVQATNNSRYTHTNWTHPTLCRNRKLYLNPYILAIRPTHTLWCTLKRKKKK